MTNDEARKAARRTECFSFERNRSILQSANGAASCKPWKGAVVVMNNPSAHKVAGVQALIEAAGAGRLFLLPYWADLNPIEGG